VANVRRLTAADLPRLRQFWIDHWGGEIVVAHGEIFRPEQMDGLVAEDEGEWIAVAAFVCSGPECEVVSLDSLRPGEGIGSMLLGRVIEAARAAEAKRVVVTTTNDNLEALGFYQRRGFELTALRRGALEETRRLKPGIPQTGRGGIPLRDELLLELALPDGGR
jgi:N-acetylglutamate synthase-like GNAT family acetyltransferase